MARVTVFQGGSVQPEAPNVVPFRAPDFGPGIGPGIAKLGEALGETAQKVDEIQDINARIEANRLSVAYNNLATTISQRVRSSLGENAESAADKGIADLTTGSQDILSKASPRARKILETEFAKRTTDYRGQWWEHGFEQKKQAYDTSSQAANDKDLETALQQSTDDAAKPYLDSIVQRNNQRATFFGLGRDWEVQENRKSVSSYFKGRALALGTTSATDAIKYATDHRSGMTEGDYESVIHTYRDESLDERAEAEVDGIGTAADTPGTTTAEGKPTKTADPRTVFNGLIIPNEGTHLVQHDSNGAPVKYGINQKANPDVDVANLTQPAAEKLFIDRYWKPSGADKLSPALAVVHADTYYLNKSEATKLLRQSGGDVNKYMELRTQWLAALHASNPAKYPDYTGRNKRVEEYAAAMGGDGTPFSFTGRITDKTSMSAVEDEVMGRKDIPLALKTRILRIARERREMLRSDKRADEDDARDALITATTKLGDNFTSVKQLPQGPLSRASPETVAALTEQAKTNRDKHNDETLRPEITATEVTDPKRFMSKDFITYLMRKGASPSLISQVQTQQSDILKKQMNAKPSVISDGTLWSVAKPAFEASGILEAPKGPTDKAGKQRAAQQQQQAVVFLQQEATEWETNNPGKKATPDIIRQWVGAAILKTKSGTPLFQANDADIYNSLGENMRNSLIRELRRRGDTAQGNELVAHVAQAYKNLRAMYPAANNRIVFGPNSAMRGVETNTDALPDQPDHTDE